MKTFKIVDMWISISLIILFTIISFVKLDCTFLIGYCVVGGWQIISMLVHHFMHWFNLKNSNRYYYHWITLIIVLIALTGMAIHLLLFIFFPLLFAAPLMAIYYTWMCYEEIFVKMQRPLAQLK